MPSQVFQSVAWNTHIKYDRGEVCGISQWHGIPTSSMIVEMASVWHAVLK